MSAPRKLLIPPTSAPALSVSTPTSSTKPKVVRKVIVKVSEDKTESKANVASQLVSSNGKDTIILNVLALHRNGMYGDMVQANIEAESYTIFSKELQKTAANYHIDSDRYKQIKKRIDAIRVNIETLVSRPEGWQDCLSQNIKKKIAKLEEEKKLIDAQVESAADQPSHVVDELIEDATYILSALVDTKLTACPPRSVLINNLEFSTTGKDVTLLYLANKIQEMYNQYNTHYNVSYIRLFTDFNIGYSSGPGIMKKFNDNYLAQRNFQLRKVSDPTQFTALNPRWTVNPTLPGHVPIMWVGDGSNKTLLASELNLFANGDDSSLIKFLQYFKKVLPARSVSRSVSRQSSQTSLSGDPKTTDSTLTPPSNQLQRLQSASGSSLSASSSASNGAPLLSSRTLSDSAKTVMAHQAQAAGVEYNLAMEKAIAELSVGRSSSCSVSQLGPQNPQMFREASSSEIFDPHRFDSTNQWVPLSQSTPTQASSFFQQMTGVNSNPLSPTDHKFDLKIKTNTLLDPYIGSPTGSANLATTTTIAEEDKEKMSASSTPLTVAAVEPNSSSLQTLPLDISLPVASEIEPLPSPNNSDEDKATAPVFPALSPAPGQYGISQFSSTSINADATDTTSKVMRRFNTHLPNLVVSTPHVRLQHARTQSITSIEQLTRLPPAPMLSKHKLSIPTPIKSSVKQHAESRSQGGSPNKVPSPPKKTSSPAKDFFRSLFRSGASSSSTSGTKQPEIPRKLSFDGK